MNPRLILAALPLILAACSGAANGRDQGAGKPGDATVATRNFDLAGFTGVSLGGSDKVEVRHGSAFAITARGPSADLDTLDLSVRDGNLQIKRKNERGNGRGERIDLVVTLPVLNNLALGGSGEMSADQLTGADANVSVGGSGSLTIAAVDAQKVNFSIGGSGNISAAGKADQAKVAIGGSGNISAEKLTLRDVDISMAGSGNVSGRATGTATISMAGSGDVTLSGGADCKVRKVGSGDVTCT